LTAAKGNKPTKKKNGRDLGGGKEPSCSAHRKYPTLRRKKNPAHHGPRGVASHRGAGKKAVYRLTGETSPYEKLARKG